MFSWPWPKTQTKELAQETPAPRVERGEIAYVKTNLGGINFIEYNPNQLVKSKGLGIYEIMRKDEQIKMALSTKKSVILSSGWYIEPASPEPIDIEIAEFVEKSFDQLEGTIEDFLKDTLIALDYGFSVSEKVWTVFEYGPKEVIGKVGYHKLKGKNPKDFEFQTDEFGNLEEKGLILTVNGNDPLPIDKFVIYTYDKEFSNYYGNSDLNAAYRAWWAKDNIIKLQNIFIEKFSVPPIIGQVTNKQQTAEMLNIIKNFQASTSIVFPKGSMELDILETIRNPADIFIPALEYYDRAISRAILVGDRLVAAGETGAYSQAEVHFKVFKLVAQEQRQRLEETVMYEQVIRPLVAVNYGENALVPRFKFNAITDEERIELVKTWGDLHQKGVVSTNFETENYIRTALGFPEIEESDIEDDVDDKETIKDESPASSDEDILDEEPKPGDISTNKNNHVAKFVQREKNKFEKRVDFKQIDKNLTNIEVKTLELMQDALKKQEEQITKVCTKKLAKGELTTTWINTGIKLRYIKDQKDAIKAMFDKGYGLGGDDVKKEVGPKKFVTAQQGIALTPEQALQYFASKANIIVGNINNQITQDLKNVLIVGLREGTSIPELTRRIQEIYQPLVESGEIIQAGRTLTPYRLEAIIRTNLSDAYAAGRTDLMKDPDLKGFVVGSMFSEILDDRTTQISRDIDGKIIRIDSPNFDKLTYPLHWNDRGVPVPVTKDELPAEFMTPEEEASFVARKQSGL